jgi:hypothetical protein
VEKYKIYASKINETKVDTFRYLNFDRLGEYVEKGDTADMGAEYKTVLDKEIERLRAQRV